MANGNGAHTFTFNFSITFVLDNQVKLSLLQAVWASDCSCCCFTGFPCSDVVMLGELSLPESSNPHAFYAHGLLWQMQGNRCKRPSGQGEGGTLTLPLGANLFWGFTHMKASAQEIINITNHEHAEDHQPRNRPPPKPSDIACFCFHPTARKLAITERHHKMQSVMVFSSFASSHTHTHTHTHTRCRGVCEKLQFTAVICF